MHHAQDQRLTIGRVMVGIAAIAAALAVPSLATSPDVRLVAGVAAFVAVVVGCNFGCEMAFGLQCPSCRHWNLRRIARHPNFFRCTSCRARFKGSLFGPRRDASGARDDFRFRKPTTGGAWRGFATQQHLDGTTSGSLLKNKRMRGATGGDVPVGGRAEAEPAPKERVPHSHGPGLQE